jgi:hypothetical protein
MEQLESGKIRTKSRAFAGRFHLENTSLDGSLSTGIT